MRRILLCCALVGLAACGPKGDSRSSASTGATATARVEEAGEPRDSSFQLDPRCPGENNTFDCARIIEHAVLLRDSARVRRSGDSLILSFGGKRVRVLADSGEDAESVHFSYRSWIPTLGVFVVHEQYYEGTAFNLVSARSGRSQYVPEEPVVSPNGRKLVSASVEEEEGYSPNRLVILRATGDTLAFELDLTPETYGFEHPKWVDDSTLDLMRVTPSDTSPKGTRSGVRARYRAGKWMVDAAPPGA